MAKKTIKSNNDKMVKDNELNYLLYTIYQKNLTSKYFANDAMYGIKLEEQAPKLALKKRM